MLEAHRRGFTLIELVVALAILMVILGITFFSISNIFRLRTVYDQEMNIQQNFRYAVSRINH